jgi:tetratricopeptide (TPR) repeat protein
VIARKPHVAWYSGLRFIPMPIDVSLSGLAAFARSADAGYVFFSGIEQLQHPEWDVLADSGLALPGFAQVEWDTLPNRHFYALYRFTGDQVDSTEFATAYRRALERYEARRPGSANALLFVAVQYLAIGDPAAARHRLDRLVQAGAQDPAVEKYLLNAALAMGDLAGAEAACRRAMALERPTAWHWGRMGDIRTGQGRLGDARDCYERAVALEPASLSYLQLLGQANIRTGEFARAAAAFERGVRLAPADVETRRYAMGAWQLAGEPSRMQRVYEEGVKAGIPAEALLGSIESSH